MNEDRLHAYVDGQVSEAERLEIEAELSRDPEAAARVSDYQRQNEALHALFDPILDQPHALGIAARRRTRWQRWGGLAAALAVGFIGGYLTRGDLLEGPDLDPIARQAMLAHAAYVPEVRHPVAEHGRLPQEEIADVGYLQREQVARMVDDDLAVGAHGNAEGRFR